MGGADASAPFGDPCISCPARERRVTLSSATSLAGPTEPLPPRDQLANQDTVQLPLEIVMTVENGVRVVAGTFVILSAGMSDPRCPLFVSQNLLFLTGLVGVMLIQSAFTGFCPTAIVLKKLGLKGGA